MLLLRHMEVQSLRYVERSLARCRRLRGHLQDIAFRRRHLYWDGRSHKPLEAMYRSLEAADQADVSKAALITCDKRLHQIHIGLALQYPPKETL